MVTRAVSSSTAAMVSAFFRVPADVLKHRVQAYVYPSVAQAARTIMLRQGVRGFYAGFGATLLRDVSALLRIGRPGQWALFCLHGLLRMSWYGHLGEC